MKMYSLCTYSAIYNTLFRLNRDCVFRLIVKPYYNINNKGTYFYSESEFRGGIYSHINLVWNYEIRNIKGNKEFETSSNKAVKNTASFIILSEEQYQFDLVINKIFSLLSNENSNIFLRDDKGIIRVNSSIDPQFKIYDKFGDLLTIEFCVMNTGDIQAEFSTGVMLYINDDDEGIFVDTMTFLNFAWFLKNFNPYNAAISMLGMVGVPQVSEEDAHKQEKIENGGFLSKVGAKKRDD